MFDFSTERDVIVSIAAVVTAGVAVFGLNTWKKKEDREVARNLLRATYEIRDAIAACRSRFIHSQEFPDNYSETSGNKKEAHTYFHQNRFKPVAEIRRKFRIVAYEAEILWGKRTRTTTDELLKCMWELESSIADYIESGGYNHPKSLHDLNSIPERQIVFTQHENDKFAERVKNVVDEIEVQFRQYL